MNLRVVELYGMTAVKDETDTTLGWVLLSTNHTYVYKIVSTKVTSDKYKSKSVCTQELLEILQEDKCKVRRYLN